MAAELKPELKQVTHILPVGINKDKLLQGLKQYLVHKAVLIVNKSAPVDREKVKYVAGEMQDALRGFAEVEVIEMNTQNPIDTALKLVDIIKKENSSGRDVMINVSCCAGNIGIACYMASEITGAKMYTAITSGEGKETEVLNILQIPTFPIKDIPQEQIEILDALCESNVDSLDELISRMRPELNKNTNAFNNERARICHHVKVLRENGFVETEKIGKNLRIRLNSLGQIYVHGRGRVSSA